MPNFDLNSRFNKDANFSQVVFGEDGYLLETELNEMQHIQDEARASLIREQIPSGVLNYFEPNFVQTTPNMFGLPEEMRVNVNGQILTIPKSTVIQLNEPPTADFKSVTGKVGYREDLVFLEAWKEEVNYNSKITKFGGEGQSNVTNHIKDSRVGVETTRRIQWKWRIRVVDDIDFDKFTSDGFTNSSSIVDNANLNRYKIFPQGGNESPITADNYYYYNQPMRNNGSYSNTQVAKVGTDDTGLYVAGRGTTDSKTILKTVDGYSYAIPLFKVKRRNSGAYSSNNGNGSATCYSYRIIFSPNLEAGTSREVQVDANFYNNVKVGDKLTTYYSESQAKYLEITNKGSSNKITVKHIIGGTSSYGSETFKTLSDRPDLTYCNIIDKRDIVDLRHKVSLTGFNYQELLEENFNKLLNGELYTKSNNKMLKTYHGVRKTPIDSNTVFYCSFDGKDIPETSNATVKNSTNSYVSSPTGLAMASSTSTKAYFTFDGLNLSSSDFVTIEYWTYPIQLYNPGYHIVVTNSSGYNSYLLSHVKQINNNLKLNKWQHLRLVLDVRNDSLDIYINGKNVAKNVLTDGYNARFKFSTIFSSPITALHLGPAVLGSTSYCTFHHTCDFSISNTNRGDTFATIPKDVTDEYACISTAFNEQRNIFGDPIMTQTCQELINASGETKRQFTITQATKGKWASGDTIKVKGLGREIISGVIDSNTALAKVVKTIVPGTKFIVDSVSSLSVGDKIRGCTSDFTIISKADGTISEIDTGTNTVTLSSMISGWEFAPNYYLVESTASSSSPALAYMNGTTPTAVTGTWTNLGTNEATFTFGTNSTLTNQNLDIQYSLNASQGQGGLSELLTNELGGEYNGKKLTKQSTLFISDDFIGKVYLSTTECPNKAFYTGTNNADTTLLTPKQLTSQMGQGDLDLLKSKNNSCSIRSTNKNNAIPQHMFSFDIIRIVEDKFGDIPSVNKVAWLKNNINEIKFNWYGYGKCPSGNLARIRCYITDTDKWGWEDTGTNYTTNSTVTYLTGTRRTTMANVIDDNGFAHFMASTDPSDGVTSSSIYTDFVSVEVVFKTESGFSVIAPENTRRDDGKSVALLVRKATKEVRRYPLGKVKETDVIVTYGEYVPYQGTSTLMNSYKDIMKDVIVTGATTQGTGSKPTELTTTISLYPTVCNLPIMSRESEYNLTYDNIVTEYGSNSPTIYSLKPNKRYNGANYYHMFTSVSGAPNFNSTTPVFRGAGQRAFSFSGVHTSDELDTYIHVLSYIAHLVTIKDELYMFVITHHDKCRTLFGHGHGVNSKPCVDTFKITGLPLIK